MSSAVNRREFIQATLAAGSVLALGFDALGKVVFAQQATRDVVGPNVFGTWMTIGADNVVTVVSPEVEYGQGTSTANAMLIAEELDADWSKMAVVQSDAAKLYANPKSGRLSTDGSYGTRGRFDQMRLIGAKARVMLVQAAAAHWAVPVEQCTTANSTVIHAASDRSATYGSLAAAAATLQVPAEVALRAPEQWRLIGTAVPRLDIVEKCTGRAKYAVDLQLPGLLHAALVRCPVVWGGTVKSYDDSALRARTGVREVINVGYAVAVLADDPWTARNAAESLQVVWDEGAAATLNSADLVRDYAQALDEQAGVVARNNGDVDAAAQQAGAKNLQADYTVPYLAHQCMEPTGATAWVHAGICEVWTPTANMGGVVRHVKDAFGFAEDKVKIHRAAFVGGSFGLRGRVDPDLEAVHLSIKVGAPVQVVRRREEDVQHGWFRPYQKTRIKATLTADGKLLAWNHKVAVQSINAHYSDEVIPFGVDIQQVNEETRKVSPFFRLPVDFYATAGSPHNLSYQIPNLRVVGVQMEVPVPVNHWRSVGFSGNTFITESFIDELARSVAQDPIEFRRTLLTGKTRPLALLDALASETQWSKRSKQRGSGWGVAFGEGFECFCAAAVHVTVSGKKLKVNRVICVYDQGQTVNLDQTEAQVQGGLVDGLSAAMFGEITLDKGRVQQSNFSDYRLYTLAQMPEIQIREVPTQGVVGSITEIITPTVIPALTNAIFDATVQRIRELPVKKQGFDI